MTFCRTSIEDAPPALWRRRLTVGLIILAIVAFNLLNNLLSSRLTSCHNRQLQAINHININASAAHFSLDKILNGDRSVKPREVDGLLSQARAEAQLMYALNRQGLLHRVFTPAPFKDSLEALLRELDTLIRVSRDSPRRVATPAAAVEINTLFRHANQAIKKSNDLLWQAITKEQAFFLKVQIGLTILSVTLALITLSFLCRYDRIRKRRLEERADQRNQEQFLAQFSRFCRDTATIAPVYELVTSWLSGHLGVDRVSAWRFSKDGAALFCLCLYDAESKEFTAEAELPRDQIPLYSAALQQDEPIIAEDAHCHPATAELLACYLQPNDIRSMLDIPLKLNGEITGVLCLEVRRQQRQWRPQEIALCMGVADQVSLAMGRTWERELREQQQATAAARLEQEVKERTMALAAANDSLRKNEARLQLIFNKAPFGAALVDFQGHFLQANEEFCRFTGYTESELVAVNFLRLVQGESRTRHEENFSHLLAGAISKCKGDDLYRRKEGGSVWGRTTIRMLREECGPPLYFMVMVENITKRKSYEDQLGKLHKAIEQSPLSILITNAAGIIEYANPFFCAVTGYELAEVVGTTPKVLKSGSHTPAFYDDLWQTIKAGKTWQGEICNRKKDGTRFWEQALIAPVTDKEGEIVSFIAVKEDISERKELADALRERSEMIASIASAALNAIIMMDNHGVISFWNKAAEKIFGWTRDEALGQDLHRLIVSEENRQKFLANFEHFRASGTGPSIGKQVELQAIRRNGAEFPVELSLSAIKVREKWHAMGIINDISERRAAQQSILVARDEAEAANRAKSDFLARMSHEIRTPMNAIIGLGSLALKMELSPKLHDYLSKIASSGKNLMAIINDILDFSKIEAKKLEIESHPFSLEKILTDLAGVTSIKAEEKGLEFMYSVAPDVPEQLIGDSVRLGQVLINLAANAIKFTESGTVILDIAVLAHGDHGVILRFSMHDTGIGLSAEQIGRLFTPFSQADGSISRNYGGTGLGLAICKRLVELMGGALKVKSRPGQGSTFTFTTPLGAPAQGSPPLPPPAPLQGLRVLVVEDNPSTREILRTTLESFSCAVTAVDSGEQGLAQFRRAAATETPFGLLLLDYRLPGMNGDAVARAVRTISPPGQQPKILLLTSLGAANVVESCLEAGCDNIMDKPVSRAALLAAISRLHGWGDPSPAAPAGHDGHRRLAGAKILVVEDNSINQQVAQELLQRAGARVTLANNGEEGVRAVLQAPYDLVLMDIQMPGLDGLQATRRIRAQGVPRLASLPIIAMTANAIKGDEAVSLAAGMNDHITKPIDPKLLFATLERWLPPRTEPVTLDDRAEDAPRLAGDPLPRIPGLATDHGGALKLNPPRKCTRLQGAPDARQRPASYTSVCEQAANKADGVPCDRIPGLDLELAVSRLGSAELCTNVLRHFREMYAAEADNIIALLESQSWDDAYRALHSLKGVVGTICAQELYALVIELEKGCQEQQAPAELVAAFKECADTLIHDLQSLL